MRAIRLLFLGCIVLMCGFLGGVFGVKKVSPQERNFTIKAKKYSFIPEVIRVNRGDTITLKLASEDVTHGFYIEGYDLDAKVRPEMPSFWVRHPSKEKDYGEPVDEMIFVASKPGKFRYRCSISCGSFHPFMQGEMIVEPNYLFPVSIGLVVGLALAGIIYVKYD